MLLIPLGTGSASLLASSTRRWWTGPLLACSPWRGRPLEVKTNATVRLVEHSLGAVFWTWRDFVGKRKIAIGDLPMGQNIVLPVGPVGQDLTTHFMCPCGSFLTTGTQ